MPWGPYQPAHRMVAWLRLYRHYKSPWSTICCGPGRSLKRWGLGVRVGPQQGWRNGTEPLVNFGCMDPGATGGKGHGLNSQGPNRCKAWQSALLCAIDTRRTCQPLGAVAGGGPQLPSVSA